MKGIRIASRYAKSLLYLSLEKGKLDEVYADMQLVGATIDQSRDLELLLLSPVIKTDTKVKVLTLVFGSKIGEISNAFMTLLTNKGREGMLGEIAQSLGDLQVDASISGEIKSLKREFEKNPYVPEI